MSELETDVAIIGCGPAGLSTALWCDDLGLKCLAFEAAAEPGGQLLLTHNSIENYLGVRASNGRDLRDIFLRQVNERGLSVRTGCNVVSLDLDGNSLNLSDGRSVVTRSIVAATGVRRRDPGIEGLARFEGKGLLHSGKKEKESARGRTAVVVGGGDAAFENALILSGAADRVVLVHRGDSFRARREFTSEVLELKNVDVRTNSVVTDVQGANRIEGVTIRDVASGESETIRAEVLIFRIGVTPNSELFRSRIDLDEQGYIAVNQECQTSRAGVYAVGDVANPVSPTIATATGMGATAAKSVFSWLMRSSDIQ